MSSIQKNKEVGPCMKSILEFNFHEQRNFPFHLNHKEIESENKFSKIQGDIGFSWTFFDIIIHMKNDKGPANVSLKTKYTLTHTHIQHFDFNSSKWPRTFKIYEPYYKTVKFFVQV